MNFSIIDPSQVRDLSADVLEPAMQGRPRVLPAAFWAATSVAERAVLGARQGIYGYPTEELVAWLRARIGTRSAIEIGAGNGALAAALGIPATDSCLQADPEVAAYYHMMGQSLVQYGPNVEALDAHAAVAKYRPQVVIACWVTHKYDPARHDAEGNQFGVAEEAIVDACEEYIFIGNTHVHRGKSVWTRPHERLETDWVYSRATNGSPDFIAAFPGNRAVCG